MLDGVVIFDYALIGRVSRAVDVRRIEIAQHQSVEMCRATQSDIGLTAGKHLVQIDLKRRNRQSLALMRKRINQLESKKNKKEISRYLVNADCIGQNERNL